ncbi:hypothetical protein Tco_0208321, partial [Tanacetum coccineum]
LLVFFSINEELYYDVNVEMKDAEPADEGKEDEEMTDAEKVDAEHKEINQEIVSVYVQDEVQTTTTAAPVTQTEKTDKQKLFLCQMFRFNKKFHVSSLHHSSLYQFQ